MPRQSSTDAGADAALAKMGYESELPRNLSMLSVLGLSFAIMAVPFGQSTTLAIGLTDGLSVTILYGWVFVSLVSLSIAASLAEICAVFPTAGGVYYWSAMLATREWAPITSWITGYLTWVGNLTVTLSINFSGGQLILSAITLWKEDFAPNEYQTILMFWAVMIVALLVNIFLSKYLDFINKLAIYWTASSVLIIFVTLFSMADNLRSGAFVFGEYDSSSSGWPAGWAWFVGLLSPAYTLTGYGMVAAMCEEIPHPERSVPKAIVLSVLAAGITGILYLLPILFTLPPVDLLLEVANGQPIGLLFKTVTGSAAGGFGLLFLILGILAFAGIGALTAASRCTYAFARDGAIPGSRVWRRVGWRSSNSNEKGGIPVYALILCTAIDMLLGLIYFGSSSAFNAFTGVATLSLSASYASPVLISILRGRQHVAIPNNPYPLGKTLGPLCNIVTLCWICLAVVLFCVPTSREGLEPATMNYASVVFAGFATISVVWYFVRGRKEFKGPPIVRGEEGTVDVLAARGKGDVEDKEAEVVMEDDAVAEKVS